jgi:soluble cytochrome b562
MTISIGVICLIVGALIGFLVARVRSAGAQAQLIAAKGSITTLEKQIAAMQSAQTETTRVTAELEAMKHQLEEVEKKQNESRDKKVAQDEEGLLAQRGLESADSELRRARLISQSLLVGKVKEFVENADVGDFITFDVLMREQIQAGATIAIRRKTGILGQFKVTEVTDDGAVASPLPGFAPVKPLPGDELILPPQY